MKTNDELLLAQQLKLKLEEQKLVDKHKKLLEVLRKYWRRTNEIKG